MIKVNNVVKTFDGFRALDGLLFFLLLVEVFLIVENLADGRIRLGCNLDEVKFKFLGNSPCLLNGIDARGNVVADETHFAGSDVLVDVVGIFGVAVGQTAVARSARTGTLRTGSGGKVGLFLHSGVY